MVGCWPGACAWVRATSPTIALIAAIESRLRRGALVSCQNFGLRSILFGAVASYKLSPAALRRL